jgi:excisionase family DNA binding protein
MYSDTKHEMTGETGNCPSPETEYLTKQELSERLKIGIRTIESWMQKRIIPFLSTGRRVLFNWTEVQWYLTAHFGVPSGQLSTIKYRRPASPMDPTIQKSQKTSGGLTANSQV